MNILATPKQGVDVIMCISLYGRTFFHASPTTLLNPSRAMTFSVLRKAMGGGVKITPPSGSHIYESVQAPIYFSPFSTLQMRKIATKIGFYLVYTFGNNFLKSDPVGQNSVAELDFA